eukprot:scaffold297803_cov31-Tisochrysis_lutea.AAC.2
MPKSTARRANFAIGYSPPLPSRRRACLPHRRQGTRASCRSRPLSIGAPGAPPPWPRIPGRGLWDSHGSRPA